MHEESTFLMAGMVGTNQPNHERPSLTNNTCKETSNRLQGLVYAWLQAFIKHDTTCKEEMDLTTKYMYQNFSEMIDVSWTKHVM